MPKLVILVEESDILTTSDGKLKLKLSPKENNGLQIKDGKLVGVRGPAGKPGSGNNQNTVGNAMGTGDGVMPIISMNSTVSRHKKYTDKNSSSYPYLHENDGVVMTSPNGGMNDNGSVAYFMYKKICSFPERGD